MVDCSPNICDQAGEAEGQGEERGEPWGHRLLSRGVVERSLAVQALRKTVSGQYAGVQTCGRVQARRGVCGVAVGAGGSGGGGERAGRTSAGP